MLMRAVARNPPITNGHPTLAWNEDPPGSSDHQVVLWARLSWLRLPEQLGRGVAWRGALAVNLWSLGLCGEVSQKAEPKVAFSAHLVTSPGGSGESCRTAEPKTSFCVPQFPYL